MITVRLSEAKLRRAGANDDQIALYREIKAHADEQRARGGLPPRTDLTIRWTRLHTLWMTVVSRTFTWWLIERELLPAVSTLGGENLRCAGLSMADLRGVDLQDADLRGADLTHALLDGANLAGANLRGANLYCAVLRRANLWFADLRDTDLRGVTFCDANLDGVDLRGARWSSRDPIPDGWKLKGRGGRATLVPGTELEQKYATLALLSKVLA